jgi:hypothetical protein
MWIFEISLPVGTVHLSTGKLIYPSYIWVDIPSYDVTRGQILEWLVMANHARTGLFKKGGEGTTNAQLVSNVGRGSGATGLCLKDILVTIIIIIKGD